MTGWTPGVRLHPGEILDLGRTRDDMVEADYRDEEVEATGWVPAAALDVVWEPDEPRFLEWGSDGTLRGGALDVRGTPGGRALATILQPDPDMDEQWWVDILDRTSSRRWLLVRVPLTWVTVVGWVPEDRVHVRPSEGGVGLIGNGRGGGWGAESPRWWTMLERGTLLVHESTKRVLGVMIWDGAAACDGPCVEPVPRVWVRACERQVRVRAVRPEPWVREDMG